MKIKNKLESYNNIIVAFAYFDRPLGINKEQIITYELRIDY